MKRGQIAGIFFFMFLISMSFVAAQQTTSPFVTQVQGALKPVLFAIFGETNSAYVFSELLFALIIFAFVYMALSSVDTLKEKGWIIWIIGISFAVLGVRFIAGKSFVELVMFPQGVFSIAVLTAVPFVVYFWFVEFGLEGPRNIVLRKICWVVFAAVFVFLWYTQFYNPTLIPANPQTGKPAIPAGLSSYGWLYLAVAVGSILLLLLDNTIQSAIAKARARTNFEVGRTKLQAELMQERRELEERRIKGIIPASTYKTLDHDLKDREKYAGLR